MILQPIFQKTVILRNVIWKIRDFNFTCKALQHLVLSSSNQKVWFILAAKCVLLTYPKKERPNKAGVIIRAGTFAPNIGRYNRKVHGSTAA